MNPELAKRLGLKLRKEPNTYRTIAGKTTLPYITEEFTIRLWLQDRKTGCAKWHEFVTTCRVAEGVTEAVLLGSRFMDKHLIYRGIDEKDLKVKVFKVEGDQLKVNNDVGAQDKVYYCKEM